MNIQLTLEGPHMKPLSAAQRYNEMLQYLSMDQRMKIFVALGCSGALDGDDLDEAGLSCLLSAWTPSQSELRPQ